MYIASAPLLRASKEAFKISSLVLNSVKGMATVIKLFFAIDLTFLIELRPVINNSTFASRAILVSSAFFTFI